MKKNTKCYIYTSVSTAIQVDGYSLDAQKDKLSKYAEFQDMEVVGEYYNEEHSGKSTNDAVNGVANYLNNHRYKKSCIRMEQYRDSWPALSYFVWNIKMSLLWKRNVWKYCQSRAKR